MLDKDHVWLRALTRVGDKRIIDDLIRETVGKEDVHKDYADCVMNVFARANSSLLKKVKEEEPNMCEAIEELFVDKIEMLTQKVESETKRADDAEKENKRLRAEMERMKEMIAAG